MVNIGKVDFLVDFDGKKLPRQAKTIGERVGASMGQAAASKFDGETGKIFAGLKQKMIDAGDLAGDNFGTALQANIRSRRSRLTSELANIFSDRSSFDQFVLSGDRVGDSLDELRGKMEALKAEGGFVGQQFKSVDAAFRKWGDTLRENEKDAAHHNAILVETEIEFQRTAEVMNEAHTEALQLNRSFDKLHAQIQRSHEEALKLNTQFDKLAKDRDLETKLTGLRDHLYDVSVNSSRVREAFGPMTEKMNSAHDEAIKLNIEFDKMSKSQDDAAEKSERNGAKFGKLSTNMKQALAIIAAIAAGGQEIAVLGSAAGAGLAVIGTSAVTAVAGLGVMVGAIASVSEKVGQLKEYSDLAAKALNEGLSEAEQKQLDSLRAITEAFPPYVAAIGALGPAFSALSEVIESSFFTPMQQGLEGIPLLLQGISPALGGFSEALGTGINDLLTSLTGPEGVGKINSILADMSNQAAPLLGILENIGGAVGNFLIIAAPYTQRFFEYLEKITGEFDKFTSSQEGRDQITEWLDNAFKIFDSLEPLIAGVGDLLANLVTPESVGRTTGFLDALTESLPFFESLLDTLGRLDVFGILATILSDIGTALIPILDFLAPIAEIIGTVLKEGIEQVGIVLQVLSVLLLPLTVVFEFFNTLVQKLTEYLAPVNTALQAMADALTNGGTKILEALIPAFEDLIDSFITLLPSPEELARIINEDVIPAIEDITNWIVDEAVPALTDLWEEAAKVIENFDFEQAQKNFEAFKNGVKIAADTIVAVLGGPIGMVNRLIDLIDILNGRDIKQFNTQSYYTVGAIPTGPSAAGRIATRPTYGLYGESGPEAIVPLDRPLSQVDESVRRLSAIAQGIYPASTSSGSGDDRSITVEAGAIVVPGTPDPELTAEAVLDRLVAAVQG